VQLHALRRLFLDIVMLYTKLFSFSRKPEPKKQSRAGSHTSALKRGSLRAFSPTLPPLRKGALIEKRSACRDPRRYCQNKSIKRESFPATAVVVGERSRRIPKGKSCLLCQHKLEKVAKKTMIWSCSRPSQDTI